MIPKLVHRIWFGQKPTPPSYENYWQAWQRQLPDYEFKIWRDSDIDDRFLTRNKITEAQGLSRKADIASYEILHQHGGVYLDCDVMPYHYLDWQKLDGDVITCNEVEDDDFCSHAVMAAAPRNIIFERATTTLAGMALNQLAPNVETGPFFFRRMLDFGSFTKLPGAAFYPYESNEPVAALFVRDLSATYGIHVWKGSWITEQNMILNIVDRLKWGDLMEPALWASEVNPEVVKLVTDHVDAVSKARVACLQAARGAVLSKYLKVRSKTPVEFLKCAFHLWESQKDGVIWHIGASDGLSSDPLRPLVVNYDPQILMLEPNPHLFERLQRNYAKNRNTTFIQSSLAPVRGQMNLHSIDPDNISSRDLPAWTAGVSSFYPERDIFPRAASDHSLVDRLQQHMEKIPVNVMTVSELLAVTGNQTPSIVVIGVESMIREIVLCVLSSGIRPQIFYYKTEFTLQSELEALAADLGKEYVLVAFDKSIAAYRTDFFLAYCNDFFIKHGIPTIYEDSLKSILRR